MIGNANDVHVQVIKQYSAVYLQSFFIHVLNQCARFVNDVVSNLEIGRVDQEGSFMLP
jgi:hypothetical protein